MRWDAGEVEVKKADERQPRMAAAEEDGQPPRRRDGLAI
jgi:hypothetical protein